MNYDGKVSKKLNRVVFRSRTKSSGIFLLLPPYKVYSSKQNEASRHFLKELQVSPKTGEG